MNTFLKSLLVSLILVLASCSNDSDNQYKEADEVAKNYFKAFVNKDHTEMMKHYTSKEKDYVLKSGYLEEGKIEYPNNFKKLDGDYILARNSHYVKTENTLLYWGKYLSPAENNEERNMWIMLKKEDDKWVIPEWKFRNKNLQKEFYESAKSEDENIYFLNEEK